MNSIYDEVMSRKFILLSFLFGILFSFLPQVSWAVPTPTPGASYSMTCLKVVNKYEPECNKANDPSCLSRGANFSPSHNVKISGNGFTKGIPVYIIGCIETNNNWKCTTGKNESVYGFQSEVIPGYDFAIYGAANPITPTDTTLSVSVHSQTASSTSHSFYAIYQTGGTVVGGNANSIQYGTPQFNQDASKCTTIRWDPEGRVFDSQTLEPLANVTVKLLNGTSPSQLVTTVPGLNPIQSTKINGAFSFYVPNGTYFLEPFLSGYAYPLNLTDIHQNYAKAYYCDKDSKNNYPIYNKQYAIIEENRLLHCDIPLKSNGIGYRSQVTTISAAHAAIPRSIFTKYEGQVSHPFTKIQLVGTVSGIVAASGNADKFGNWEILLDNAKSPQIAPGVPDSITLHYVKVDLTTGLTTTRLLEPLKSIFNRLTSLFSFTVQAQGINTQPVTFEPILRYIEGYANDKLGNPIPNALVRIRLKMSNGLVYETMADAKGFFTIESKNLPIFSYFIEVIGSGGSPITYSTSEFVQQNKIYLANNKINLMTATKNGQPVAGSGGNSTQNPAPTKTTLLGTQFGTNPSGTPKAEVSQDARAGQADVILIFMIIIILITAVGVGIYLYLRKRRLQEPLV